MEAVPKAPQNAASKALWDYFGFEAFRAGQAEAIEAVMTGRDALVVMATGGGKSICYQIPALATTKAVIVVSPLISLMQDQVIRLNQLAPGSAIFLGSSQADRGADDAVGRGEKLFVYVTPEKVMSMVQGNLIERLHRSRGIGLIAVDEAHCVCEWGNDFRPEYRALSSVRAALPSGVRVPIMALTGTATERVRQDIRKSLRMAEDAHVYVGPFDRPNLAFKVFIKKSTGVCFADLCKELKDPTSRPSSTIIYCPTTDDVEGLHSFFTTQLPPDLQGRVLKYHAKLGLGTREDSHRAFLTGASPLVIATVAFGMGIDKPDVRRVIHYGAPSTLEAYYQQAGRAGRDGFPATCELHYTPGEFLNYRTSKFYRPDHISAEHRDFLDSSCLALQRFAEDTSECRQLLLVRWFGQQQLTVADGHRCGMCDNSKALQKSGSQARDYTADAKLIAEALSRMPRTPNQVVDRILKERTDVTLQGTPGSTKQHKTEYIKELMQQLKKEGFLTSRTSTFEVGSRGHAVGYESFELTPKAREIGRIQVLLPVLRVVREEEEKAAARQARDKELLKSAGVDACKIPKEEMKVGRGPTLESELRWARTIARFKEGGKEDRLKKLEELYAFLDKWRQEQAAALSMSPFAVLADHVMRTVATTCEQAAVTTESLKQVGVRGQVDALHAQIQDWQRAHGVGAGGQASTGGAPQGDPVLIVPPSFQPTAWPGAGKFTPVIKDSYTRFHDGKEDLATIAMRRDKPVQVDTIIGHLTTAMLNGMAVDFSRFPKESVVHKSQWDMILRELDSNGADLNDAKMALKPIFEACQEKVTYGHIRTVLSLLRTGFPREPTWAAACEETGAEDTPDAKRPRLVATPQ